LYKRDNDSEEDAAYYLDEDLSSIKMGARSCHIDAPLLQGYIFFKPDSEHK